MVAVIFVASGTILTAFAQSPKGSAVPVTPDNFARAETDMYLAIFVKRGSLGKFVHLRDLPPLEGTGVRANRDTLYSEAVFDLDAGPVTITLPDAGKRFMSMMVVNEDHYAIEVDYGAGSHTLTKQTVGTRYVFVALRTLVDPNDAEGFRPRTRTTGCDHGQADRRPRKVRGAELGRGEPEEGTWRAD